MSKKNLPAALLLIFWLSVAAQGQSPLKNQDIIDLHAAGLSVEVIVAKIKASPSEFDMSVQALQELKKVGIGDAVILAMMDAGQKGKPAETHTPASAPSTAKSTSSSEPAAQSDRWRGLVIDQTTVEDAKRILGEPKKDNSDSIRTYPLNKRLSVDHNTKGLRKLRYEKLEDVERVELIFKDEKLVIIALDLDKEIPAGNISRIYNAEFEPKFSGIDTSLEPRKYERHKGRLYPKQFPDTYHLIAYTDKAIVSAFVGQSIIGNFLMGSRRDQLGDDDRGGFPGKVKTIQIISRTLENRQGEDTLK